MTHHDQANTSHANGIDFISEAHDQRYFDRKRNARREKKLSVGAHLTLLFRYDMTLRDADLEARFGKRSLEGVAFEDAVIELSYRDASCTIPNDDCWLGFMASNAGEVPGEYQVATFWEVAAPDVATYQATVERLRHDLQALVPHQSAEPESPTFIHG